jgi:hypothetical protein
MVEALHIITKDMIMASPALGKALLGANKWHIPLLAFEMESDFVDAMIYVIEKVMMRSSECTQYCAFTATDLGYRCTRTDDRLIFANTQITREDLLEKLTALIQLEARRNNLHVDFASNGQHVIKLFNTCTAPDTFTRDVKDISRREIRTHLGVYHYFGYVPFNEILLCERSGTDYVTGFYPIVERFSYEQFPKFRRLSYEEEQIKVEKYEKMKSALPVLHARKTTVRTDTVSTMPVPITPEPESVDDTDVTPSAPSSIDRQVHSYVDANGIIMYKYEDHASSSSEWSTT